MKLEPCISLKFFLNVKDLGLNNHIDYILIKVSSLSYRNRDFRQIHTKANTVPGLVQTPCNYYALIPIMKTSLNKNQT